MTQTLFKKEDPLNLNGDCPSSSPLGTWSSCNRRRRGAPIYKRRYNYVPKGEYEAPRKQPKPQYGPGPWFQPPRRPYWALYSNWGCCGGPWRPPPAGFRKPFCPMMQMISVYGLHPFCLCSCSCWGGPCNPGWERPPGRKKRWGRRGRGLRRNPRRPFPKSPPVDLSSLLRPVNVCGWRAPGMSAPPNTTQFIMNQIYEDMRQQEQLERQQEALRAQQAQAGGSSASPAGSVGNDAPPSGGEEDSELQERLYNFWQNPSLLLSPVPVEEKQSPPPQLVKEEVEERNEEEYEEEVCNVKKEEEGEEEEEEEEEAEEEEEDGETEEEDRETDEDVEEGEEEEEVEEDEEEEEEEEEDEEEEGVEEVDQIEEDEDEEEGLEEEQQREDNPLPLEMPLSILVGAEEERKNFIDYTYLGQEQIIPRVPQEALFMVQDINHQTSGRELRNGMELI